jgi:hypothetical protein
MGTTTTSPVKKVLLTAPFILSMAFSEQGIQKGLMAGAAMVAGTTAASPRLG